MIKKLFRNIANRKLNSLSKNEYEEASRKIVAELSSLNCWKNAKSVFLFYPTLREPNIIPLIKMALIENKKVYLPRCLNEIGKMELVNIISLKELKIGKYNIFEPTGNKTISPNEINLALIPCLAGTKDGFRLGHGGGYYDRFLANYNSISILICFNKLLFSNLPTEFYDKKTNFVLTDKKTFYNRI